VIAPDGLAERLDALHAEPGFTAAALDVERLEPGTQRVGDLVIETARVWHTEDSYAFRVSTGRDAGLVYSGDCGRASDLEALIEPGDVLLAEVSFGAGPVPEGAAHLDGPGVGALATRCGISRVLLTHLLMGFDEAATVTAVEEAFSGPVALVNPGDSIRIAG
jgi:ribonuclease BN (tRNA processing enzyme)